MEQAPQTPCGAGYRGQNHNEKPDTLLDPQSDVRRFYDAGWQPAKRRHSLMSEQTCAAVAWRGLTAARACLCLLYCDRGGRRGRRVRGEGDERGRFAPSRSSHERNSTTRSSSHFASGTYVQ